MQGLIINRATHETMLRLLENAVTEWPEFDTDEPIDASSFIEWFGGWRDEAKAAVQATNHEV